MKNVIITVLAVLVLGLGGYLVYDKVIKKGETNKTNEVVNNNQQTQIDLKHQFEFWNGKYRKNVE